MDQNAKQTMCMSIAGDELIRRENFCIQSTREARRFHRIENITLDILKEIIPVCKVSIIRRFFVY